MTRCAPHPPSCVCVASSPLGRPIDRRIRDNCRLVISDRIDSARAVPLHHLRHLS